MPSPTRNWKRLAEAILARREEQLGLTQEQLANLADVHVTTVRNLERGRESTGLPRSTRKVETALGWGPGSFASILGGGEPTLAETTTPPQLDPDKLRDALEAARDTDGGRELAFIFEADISDPAKETLAKLHAQRIEAARRQTQEDLERLERAEGKERA